MAKINDVEAKRGFRLLIELDTGRVIYLNMTDKIETVRFHDLKDVDFFEQVETDGYSVYWDAGRISMSLTELNEMTRVSVQNASVQGVI